MNKKIKIAIAVASIAFIGGYGAVINHQIEAEKVRFENCSAAGKKYFDEEIRLYGAGIEAQTNSIVNGKVDHENIELAHSANKYEAEIVEICDSYEVFDIKSQAEIAKIDLELYRLDLMQARLLAN